MPYATSRDAGEQISSDFEGRHVECQESDLVHPSHTDGFVDKGDPVVMGNVVGVAFHSAASATEVIAIDTEGIWALSVVAQDDFGNVAVARGDQLFINRTTAIISKIRNPGTNVPFGRALYPITSGSTAVIAVKVHCDPESVMDQGKIFVSPAGNDTYGDGSKGNPVASLTAAFLLVTATRKVIHAEGGDYVEAACLSWPTISGVQLIIGGDATISTDSEEDQVIEIAPGAQTSTFEATIKALGSLCIDHGNAGQDGIKVNHDSVGKKLIVTLWNVYGNANSDSDKTLTVTHGGSGNAVRIYWQNHLTDEIEGAIYFETQDGGDRFEAHQCWFSGGIETSTGAVALNILLNNCIVKHAGVTGGNAAQLLYAAYCLSEAARVFAALDTDDLAGSHTESLLFPAS